MLGNRSWDEWIRQYSLSHQNRINRFCHTLGIPLIVLSLLGLIPALIYPHLWMWVWSLFGAGWVLQFIGHAFEGKPPEFFRDWRFLLVGLRWWFAKIRGKA
ncbi:DUF962 domain-containing protein [bacterium SCSIO 12741]|nr:DUF962 domain-containing protein [bacterium SCSIO 12741]